MKLSCDKWCEVVFTESSRKRWHVPLPGIVHCCSLKMLGVMLFQYQASCTAAASRCSASCCSTTRHRALLQPQDARGHVAPVPGIVHCCSLKMLGVVIADDFSTRSVTRDVQFTDITTRFECCAVTVWATPLCGSLSFHRRRLSDVRCQRMARSHQDIWSSAHQLSDWSHPTSWILLAADLVTFDELYDTADDQLFNNVLWQSNHV